MFKKITKAVLIAVGVLYLPVFLMDFMEGWDAGRAERAKSENEKYPFLRMK